MNQLLEGESVLVSKRASVSLVPLSTFRVGVDYTKEVDEISTELIQTKEVDEIPRRLIQNLNSHIKWPYFRCREDKQEAWNGKLIKQEITIFESKTGPVSKTDLLNSWQNDGYEVVDVFGLLSLAKIDLPRELMTRKIVSVERYCEVVGAQGYPYFIGDCFKDRVPFRTLQLDYSFDRSCDVFMDPKLLYAAMTLVED